MTIEKLNGKYIGFHCTPSRWIQEPEYKEITVIKMSCGGGMGGSSWSEYVHRTDIHEGINKYYTINEKWITLNSNYIVEAKDYTLVTARMATTNSNYYPENNCLGKKLDYVKEIPITLQFLVEDNFEVELVNKYSGDAKKMNRIWQKKQEMKQI